MRSLYFLISIFWPGFFSFAVAGTQSSSCGPGCTFLTGMAFYAVFPPIALIPVAIYYILRSAARSPAGTSRDGGRRPPERVRYRASPSMAG